MLKSIFNIIALSALISVSGCNPFSDESLFNASDFSMNGYKMGAKISDIQTNPKYLFFHKDSKNSLYYVKGDNKKQITLSIVVDNNNNISGIQGSYLYDNLETCHEVMKEIYDNNMEVFPLKQIGQVNDKNYIVYGVLKNHKFSSMCGTASTGEVLHMSSYLDKKTL